MGIVGIAHTLLGDWPEKGHVRAHTGAVAGTKVRAYTGAEAGKTSCAHTYPR
jgi:hypothetical protein